MNETITNVLADILGKNAIHSSDFKVERDVQYLTMTVNYLFTQLSQIKNFLDDDDTSYVDDVKNKAIEILKQI